MDPGTQLLAANCVGRKIEYRFELAQQAASSSDECEGESVTTARWDTGTVLRSCKRWPGWFTVDFDDGSKLDVLLTKDNSGSAWRWKTRHTNAARRGSAAATATEAPVGQGATSRGNPSNGEGSTIRRTKLPQKRMKGQYEKQQRAPLDSEQFESRGKQSESRAFRRLKREQQLQFAMLSDSQGASDVTTGSASDDNSCGTADAMLNGRSAVSTVVQHGTPAQCGSKLSLEPPSVVKTDLPSREQNMAAVADNQNGSAPGFLAREPVPGVASEATTREQQTSKEAKTQATAVKPTLRKRPTEASTVETKSQQPRKSCRQSSRTEAKKNSGGTNTIAVAQKGVQRVKNPSESSAAQICQGCGKQFRSQNGLDGHRRHCKAVNSSLPVDTVRRVRATKQDMHTAHRTLPSMGTDEGAPTSCLAGVVDAPTFHPTEEEFLDPLKYIESIRPEAEQYGICNIVPPKSWNSELKLQPNIRFRPSIQKLWPRPPTKKAIGFLKTHKHFTPKAFRKHIDELTGQLFGPEAARATHRAPDTAEATKTEERFWQHLQDNTVQAGTKSKCVRTSVPEVLYGSDVISTGHRNETDWNLQRFVKQTDNILHYVNYPIHGVTTPMLYFGMLYSMFCWHVEDDCLNSISYLHEGSPKSWWGVPASASQAFKRVFDETFADLIRTNPALQYAKHVMISPSRLAAAGVPVSRLLHRPGTFVVTFPDAYHCGFNHGGNVAEAVNFAGFDWFKYGRDCGNVYRQLPSVKSSVLSMERVLCDLARNAASVSTQLRKHSLQHLQLILEEYDKHVSSIAKNCSMEIEVATVLPAANELGVNCCFCNHHCYFVGIASKTRQGVVKRWSCTRHEKLLGKTCHKSCSVFVPPGHIQLLLRKLGSQNSRYLYDVRTTSTVKRSTKTDATKARDLPTILKTWKTERRSRVVSVSFESIDVGLTLGCESAGGSPPVKIVHIKHDGAAAKLARLTVGMTLIGYENLDCMALKLDEVVSCVKAASRPLMLHFIDDELGSTRLHRPRATKTKTGDCNTYDLLQSRLVGVVSAHNFDAEFTDAELRQIMKRHHVPINEPHPDGGYIEKRKWQKCKLLAAALSLEGNSEPPVLQTDIAQQSNAESISEDSTNESKMSQQDPDERPVEQKPLDKTLTVGNDDHSAASHVSTASCPAKHKPIGNPSSAGKGNHDATVSEANETSCSAAHEPPGNSRIDEEKSDHSTASPAALSTHAMRTADDQPCVGALQKADSRHTRPRKRHAPAEKADNPAKAQKLRRRSLPPGLLQSLDGGDITNSVATPASNGDMLSRHQIEAQVTSPAGQQFDLQKQNQPQHDKAALQRRTWIDTELLLSGSRPVKEVRSPPAVGADGTAAAATASDAAATRASDVTTFTGGSNTEATTEFPGLQQQSLQQQQEGIDLLHKKMLLHQQHLEQQEVQQQAQWAQQLPPPPPLPSQPQWQRQCAGDAEVPVRQVLSGPPQGIMDGASHVGYANGSSLPTQQCSMPQEQLAQYACSHDGPPLPTPQDFPQQLHQHQYQHQAVWSPPQYPVEPIPQQQHIGVPQVPAMHGYPILAMMQQRLDAIQPGRATSEAAATWTTAMQLERHRQWPQSVTQQAPFQTGARQLPLHLLPRPRPQQQQQQQQPPPQQLLHPPRIQTVGSADGSVPFHPLFAHYRAAR
jgi:hypothetical protein